MNIELNIIRNFGHSYQLDTIADKPLLLVIEKKKQKKTIHIKPQYNILDKLKKCLKRVVVCLSSLLTILSEKSDVSLVCIIFSVRRQTYLAR